MDKSDPLEAGGELGGGVCPQLLGRRLVSNLGR